MSSRDLTAAFAVMCLAIAGRSHLALAQVACRYEVAAIIQAPPCGIGSGVTRATAISPDGQVVVGYAQCPLGGHLPFKWTAAGGFQFVLLPPWLDEASPEDVNDSRIMVGTGNNPQYGQRGFVCDLNTGVWTQLLPQNAPVGWSGASAISANGLVCGYRSIGSKGDPVNPQTAYYWSASGGFSDLGLVNGNSSFAHDVNDSGLVCVSDGFAIDPGRKGYLWSGANLSPIDFVPGGISSHIDDLTPNGWSIVTGTVQQSPYVGATYARKPNGVLLPLSSLPGQPGAGAAYMNSIGIAAGRCGQGTACIWHDMKAVQVSTMLTQPFNGSLDWAMISDNQKVVCRGTSATIGSIALVLTPVMGVNGDTNCDGAVNHDDLLDTIQHWGDCAGCNADFDHDFRVGVADLLYVIIHWTG